MRVRQTSSGQRRVQGPRQARLALRRVPRETVRIVIAAGPVLRVLLALPFCAGHTRDAPRLEIIATAIATVSDTPADAAALLTIGQHESAWCESVHAGRVRGGNGRGLWQIEPGSRRVPPFAGVSIEATTHAAGEALWLWRHSYTCGPDLVSRFRVYAGLGCDSPWQGAVARAKVMRWITWRLEL